MILAIDQGTTGTHLPRLRRGGPRSSGAPTRSSSSTSRSRAGSSTTPTEIWEVTRRGRRPRRSPTPGIDGAELDGDRDHEPARDRRRLGSGDRRAGPPRARLAGPPHRRALRRAARGRPRAAGPRADRARRSTPTSRRPRSSGCCATSTGAERRARSARSTPGSLFKLDRPRTSPTSRTPRGRCSSTSDRLAWDDELCDLLGIDPGVAARAAALARRLRRRPREFGGEVPVAGIAGDQQAALFGQACHAPGDGQEHLRHRQLRPAQHRRRRHRLRSRVC